MGSNIKININGESRGRSYGEDGDSAPPGMTVVHSNVQNEKSVKHNLTPGKVEIETDFLTEEEKKDIIINTAVEDLDLDQSKSDEDRYINLIINENETGDIEVIMVETRMDYIIDEDGSWNPNETQYPNFQSDKIEGRRVSEDENGKLVKEDMETDKIKDSLKWDGKIDPDPHNEFEENQYGNDDRSTKELIESIESEDIENGNQNTDPQRQHF
jgi:hypothetical protein